MTHSEKCFSNKPNDCGCNRTTTTQPQPSAEQRARELATDIATKLQPLPELNSDKWQPVSKRRAIIEILLPELTTIITKADERDAYKGRFETCEIAINFVRDERNSYKAKAEALDWLEKDDKICDFIFARNLEGNWFITEPYKFVYSDKCKTLLEAITTARKDSK